MPRGAEIICHLAAILIKVFFISRCALEYAIAPEVLLSSGKDKWANNKTFVQDLPCGKGNPCEQHFHLKHVIIASKNSRTWEHFLVHGNTKGKPEGCVCIANASCLTESRC